MPTTQKTSPAGSSICQNEPMSLCRFAPRLSRRATSAGMSSVSMSTCHRGGVPAPVRCTSTCPPSATAPSDAHFSSVGSGAAGRPVAPAQNALPAAWCSGGRSSNKIDRREPPAPLASTLERRPGKGGPLAAGLWVPPGAEQLGHALLRATHLAAGEVLVQLLAEVATQPVAQPLQHGHGV